jgi:hypothetical protein
VVRWGTRARVNDWGRDATMLTGWLRYAARVGTGDQGDIEDFVGEGDAWAALFADVVHGAATLDAEREQEWETWRATAYAQFTIFRAHHDPGGELARWAEEQGMDLEQAGRRLASDPAAGPLELKPLDEESGDAGDDPAEAPQDAAPGEDADVVELRPAAEDERHGG